MTQLLADSELVRMRDMPGTPYRLDIGQADSAMDADVRVKQLRASGSLTPEVLDRIRKYFRVKDIYHSSAIEGNSLTVGETRIVVESGLTITGRPAKDQAEARNLALALDYLEDLANNMKRPITESDVRQLHSLVLKDIDVLNAGRYRTLPVEITGSSHKPPHPDEVPARMHEFGVWLEKASMPAESVETGLLVAAVAHAWFVTIHPFLDGNGRVARLILNLMLMRFGYPIVVITKDEKARYYDALEESQTSNLSEFVAVILDCLHDSLEEYEAAAAQHRENEEWAKAIADTFTQQERIRVHNDYEIWKSAMALLKVQFSQMTAMVDRNSDFGHAYFKDFGGLDFDRYADLRRGRVARTTWFFRVDFRSGEQSARYLFFFAFPSSPLRKLTDVTCRIAREERPYWYQQLDSVTSPRVPALAEIGYVQKDEMFLGRYRDMTFRADRAEVLAKRFLEDVVRLHFASEEGLAP